LDTINRTYRNIDMAIEQQAQDVANLASKMAKLNVASALHLPSTRDKRLPDTRSKRPVNVTPHVAVSTATALNAERSAQRLKLALLAVRKEPLLNIEAALASAPVVFDSPRKPNKFDSDVQGQLLAWSIPDFRESPTHALPSRRSSGVVSKRHLPPVALKRSPASQTTAPLNFDWGPLPGVTPMETISADVRRKDGRPQSHKSLGGSWVLDDFKK
jgi:nucleoporin NUP159